MYNEKRELIASYRATPQILNALLQDVSDAAAALPPEDDGWAIAEIICHLLDAEQRTFERVIRIRDEERPSLAVFPDDDYRGRSAAGTLAAFSSLRTEHVRLLEGLDSGAWSRTGMHASEGEVSILDLTRHIAAHDAEHLAQIARQLRSAHRGSPPATNSARGR